MDYVFTEDTVQVFSAALTNMPVKRNHEQKLKVKAGDCLNKISFKRLLELLTIAAKRIDLDLTGIDLQAIKGNKDPLTEEEIN